jgi:hypothetical protein
MEHGDRVLHKFVHGLVGAALDVLLNQFLSFWSKADFHEGILTHDRWAEMWRDEGRLAATEVKIPAQAEELERGTRQWWRG